VGDVEIRFEKVRSLDFADRVFCLTTDVGESLYSSVLIASGTKPIEYTTQGLQELKNKRLFYEVNAIVELTDRKIAVIGAGDAAFDYALNLSRKNNITIYNRSQRVSCLPVLRDRVRRNRSIMYKSDHILVSVEACQDTIMLYFDHKGFCYGEQFDYLLISIGRRPNLDFVSPALCDKLTELEVKHDLIRIGDVKNGSFRQVGISVGDGIRAAMLLGKRIATEGK